MTASGVISLRTSLRVLCPAIAKDYPSVFVCIRQKEKLGEVVRKRPEQNLSDRILLRCTKLEHVEQRKCRELDCMSTSVWQPTTRTCIRQEWYNGHRISSAHRVGVMSDISKLGERVASQKIRKRKCASGGYCR